MRKVDEIRRLLGMGCSPKEIAKRIPCASSLVYQVKGLQGTARLSHQIAAIQQELLEIYERLAKLERQPDDFSERMLTRDRN